MKITIDTDEIVIRSILDIEDGEINTPIIMQTNVRNLILAIARNELLVVQCIHEPTLQPAYLLCAHVTDNPALGERLLPICVIPADNGWIASMRPPPNVPKHAFVTPVPPSDHTFVMLPVDDLSEADDAVREHRQQEEEGDNEENRQADESTLYDDTGKPKFN